MSAPAANVEKSSVVKGSFLERGVRVYPDTLMPKLRRLKGDGIINVRFDQTQVLPVNPSHSGNLGSSLFLWPQVTITEEVVKLAPGGTVQLVVQPG